MRQENDFVDQLSMINEQWKELHAARPDEDQKWTQLNSMRNESDTPAKIALVFDLQRITREKVTQQLTLLEQLGTLRTGGAGESQNPYIEELQLVSLQACQLKGRLAQIPEDEFMDPTIFNEATKLMRPYSPRMTFIDTILARQNEGIEPTH